MLNSTKVCPGLCLSIGWPVLNQEPEEEDGDMFDTTDDEAEEFPVGTADDD
jgi:hypothetical protein